MNKLDLEKIAEDMDEYLSSGVSEDRKATASINTYTMYTITDSHNTFQTISVDRFNQLKSILEDKYDIYLEYE